MTLDAKILSLLRSSEQASISPDELSQRLQVSLEMLAGRIHALRELGYEIQASPHVGYRLLNSPDLLHADDLIARLGTTKVVGREIHVFQETTSTNDLLERMAREQAREGVVVFAETQTKGRGRLGRPWLSPSKKGLWFSVLLRPHLRPAQATQLTVASATALRRAIHRQTRLNPEIKWPNDILLNGRKVAGILTELRAEVDDIQYVILGIGVDVNLAEADFPEDLRASATSLSIELKKILLRPELAASVLRELDADYGRINSGHFSDVAEEWQSCCTTLGHDVVIRAGSRQIRGRAESLGEEGELLLRTEHGHLERVVGGDVTLEKPPRQ